MLRRFEDLHYTTFKIWRKKCPFWAGLLLVISGFAMLFPAITDLSIGDITLAISNNSGIKIILLSVILWICGVSMWVNPGYRVPAGIVGLIIGILSLQAANFGGFGLGLICSIVGSALGLSWYPRKLTEANSIESEDRDVKGEDNFLSQQTDDHTLNPWETISTKSEKQS